MNVRKGMDRVALVLACVAALTIFSCFLIYYEDNRLLYSDAYKEHLLEKRRHSGTTVGEIRRSHSVQVSENTPTIPKWKYPMPMVLAIQAFWAAVFATIAFLATRYAIKGLTVLSIKAYGVGKWVYDGFKDNGGDQE